MSFELLKNKENKENKKEMTISSDQLFKMFDEWKLDNNVTFDINKLKFCVRLTLLKINGLSTKKTNTINMRAFDCDEIKKHFNVN